ncbi:FAD:protein FMN transferase [Chryseotalea sanaruensis]|uniref:FAD:protein FMN transferase n=1 Tax=Chryseotalea sanaruensis TaxID=2482724 RepID=A0A401U5Z1_9BACT|nr:FAD:protein FMN transferase [Chryseotalea sanaruensis]GCC50282.1 FAD:protein FMN transferase [Chryseotalea sanaruensis]
MSVTMASKVFNKVTRLMGNRFEISVVAEDEEQAMHVIEKAIAEIQRIEKLLTTFDAASQTNQINEQAGIKPVAVDREVFDLIERSLKISRLTQGAFDITYGSLDKRFWNFDTQMKSLPKPEDAKNAVNRIGYQHVILNKENQTVFVKQIGTRIGFGGIGKGYAADRAKHVLQQSGVVSGIVNASGDLTVWGTQPDGKNWTVGIADPQNKHMPFASLELKDASIATSGNYEKFVIIDGKKYSHNIDPRTGYPVHGIKSTTIICKSAELADAMATPITVMGVKKGLYLIDQLKDIACIIIDDHDQVFHSKNIKLS